MREVPYYTCHEGTLKISGSTIPGKAAGRAMNLFRNRVECIDFFCIGGNANQQTMKSLGVFKLFVEDHTNNDLTLAFIPLHVRTITSDDCNPNGITKNATVWRTVIIKLTDVNVTVSPGITPKTP